MAVINEMIFDTTKNRAVLISVCPTCFLKEEGIYEACMGTIAAVEVNKDSTIYECKKCSFRFDIKVSKIPK